MRRVIGGAVGRIFSLLVWNGDNSSSTQTHPLSQTRNNFQI
jgi:hypothetical protein